MNKIQSPCLWQYPNLRVDLVNPSNRALRSCFIHTKIFSTYEPSYHLSCLQNQVVNLYKPPLPRCRAKIIF